MAQKIVADLRATSEVVKQFDYVSKVSGVGVVAGEVVELKASGTWTGVEVDDDLDSSGTTGVSHSHDFPVSLHVTMYPGCPVLPVLGDRVRVTIERVD